MIVELFAGPGGWGEGARRAGLDDVVGLELDADACATAAAAGHRRVRADVATYPAERFAGVDGLIASPPCPDFSQGGRRRGRTGDTGRLVDTVPAWVRAVRPRWIACEQVPEVLPIWREHAALYRSLGYSVAVAVLNAADYGVAQTRRRAILVASLDRTARLPEPTHAETPAPALFGTPRLPWVAMGDAVDLGRLAGDVELNTGRDWKKGGTRDDAQTVPTSRPAPTVAGVPTQWRWTARRPARTITGTPGGVGGRMGHGPTTVDGAAHVNVTLAEALVLQGFRPDYPVAGRNESRWQQVGNAIPPPLAAAILDEISR